MNPKTKFKTTLALIGLALITITSCTNDNPLPATPYEVANPSTGGIMYDKFWSTEANFDQTDPNLETFNSYPDFFRCKQCHAWDGLGDAGSYIGRKPSTSRPYVSRRNVYDIGKSYTEQELFDALKRSSGRRDVNYDLSKYDPTVKDEVLTEGNKMPDLTQFMSDEQLWDLAKFIKEGMFDVSELYEGTYSGTAPNGSASYANIGLSGDATNGKTYYNNNCASCHGETGVAISLDGLGVGGFTRSKPYEVQHKAKYGQLGSDPAMVGQFDVTVDEMRDLYKALANETDFPDEPSSIISYSMNVQPIFNGKCVSCHQPGGPGAKLDLTEGSSYANLFPNYVNTGSPATSLIYTVPSPDGNHSSKYSSGESDVVLTWIEQGAENN